VDAKRFLEVKQRAEQAQKEADKAAGALEQTLTRLKQYYKVTNMKEAAALAKKLDAEAKEAEDEFDEAFAQFEREWAAKLP